ncbi:MAG: hypothetical protein AB1598_03830 [Thermodesulfobacteriota bacterium]
MTSTNETTENTKRNPRKGNSNNKNIENALKLRFLASDLSDEEKEGLLFRVFDILLYE